MSRNEDNAFTAEVKAVMGDIEELLVDLSVLSHDVAGDDQTIALNRERIERDLGRVAAVLERARVLLRDGAVGDPVLRPVFLQFESARAGLTLDAAHPDTSVPVLLRVQGLLDQAVGGRKPSNNTASNSSNRSTPSNAPCRSTRPRMAASIRGASKMLFFCKIGGHANAPS